MDTQNINTATSDTTGTLIFQVTSTIGLIPVAGASINVVPTTEPEQTPLRVLTDSTGKSEPLTLPTPPLSYSLSPSEPRPYGEYNITIEATGYEPLFVSGAQLLPEVITLQPLQMIPTEVSEEAEEVITIPPHTLYGDYPAKIEEEEIKPIDESGEVVLSRVVIPEFVVVHDGVPNNAQAPNYYVPYKDYIKNVASCEIYATWAESTIYANILAIMSFTLNRVYTEWYRNRGYNFTITSSTAYDQKYVRGQTIPENINFLVDSVFNNYLSRPGVRQPIFTAYCDGKNTTCNGLSQWGSKYLGDEGYSAIEILRYYYGNNIFINQTEYVSGVPTSWPGYTLSQGSSGTAVSQIQSQLNRISDNYPLIPKLDADGIYGPLTSESVRVFQRIFNLPQSGTVDFATWYAISNIFVAVSRLAEP